MNDSLQKSAPTASKLLSAPQTLKLLERLRTDVGIIATRAAEQERDIIGRLTKLRMQYEQAVEEARTQSIAEIGAEKNAASQKKELIHTAFESRARRITSAGNSARARRLAEIDTAEKERTIEIQDRLASTDRQRDENIRSGKATLDSHTDRLSESADALAQVEAKAKFALGGIFSLSRVLKHPPETHVEMHGDENALFQQFEDRLTIARRAIGRCKWMVLPLLFKVLPIWLWLIAALGAPFALVPELRQFNFQAVPLNTWLIIGGSFVGIFVLYFLGGALAKSSAQVAAIALANARKIYVAAGTKVHTSHTATLEHARTSAVSSTQALNTSWKQLQAEARNLRTDWTTRLVEKANRLSAANEERKRKKLLELEQSHIATIATLTEKSTANIKNLDTLYNENSSKLNATRDASRASATADWQRQVLPLLSELQNAALNANDVFVPWNSQSWENLSLPPAFVHAARFGELQVDLEKFLAAPRDTELLPLPEENRLNLPLLLSVPDAGSLLFETKTSGHEQIIGDLNSIVLRLLTNSPPGRLAFTIFDPVGLGQNFAGIMHLADFEERVISSRIWTQQAQFEQRLADLNEHIEKVTQMYLRNEYATLAEYNAQAGRLAEKYHFLVIADFPVNFSDTAAKRLQSIIASGPRCGVFTLVHWDQRRQPPLELVPDEVRKNSLRIVPKGESLVLANADWDGTQLVLDAPPDADRATQLLHQIGKASVDSYRVEMPFEEVAPAEKELWSLETTRELRVPIGRTGATKLQYLSFGQGTRQHGLVAGKTGSGKSTLFHVIITNLAAWCSPEQVEFYLVDFKKGVEFKCYATHKLPHARVIAIESDREFGLSVLQRIDDELKRRGDLFRKLAAQDLAGYKRAGGTESMPRVLLLIDEFQELFVEDDRVSQGAALLLDRIVRQGRAFGIHVLLGSQTLGGAYTLARATIGQMVVRIALQCNEADAYLIMNEDNPAPRLLSRPGEAIYNDEGGALQGNSPFQIVWLPDQTRDDWLEKVHEHANGQASNRREPIIFEGNAPANVRDNPVLRALLNADKLKPVASPRVWLGAPNSIKGPTEGVFHRQSGNHLLIVGQREEAALAMLVVSQISLAAQLPEGKARFYIFDCSPPDSPEARLLERISHAIPGGVKIVGPGETQEVIGELTAELDRRNEQPGGNAPSHFLFIHGLQQNKKLRFDEEASFSLDPTTSAGNPGLGLNKLITEGASQGFHVLASCDTYNNVMRMLSRKALSEFEMRTVFQMSANDSASLIESPAANNLGLHRAILFNGQQGWMETFRPYALPDEAWLEEAGEKLAKLHTA